MSCWFASMVKQLSAVSATGLKSTLDRKKWLLKNMIIVHNVTQRLKFVFSEKLMFTIIPYPKAAENLQIWQHFYGIKPSAADPDVFNVRFRPITDHQEQNVSQTSSSSHFSGLMWFMWQCHTQQQQHSSQVNQPTGQRLLLVATEWISKLIRPADNQFYFLFYCDKRSIYHQVWEG